jgi:DNA replication initiation complex subunit (GINS family)
MSIEDEVFTFETIVRVYREERNSTTLTKLPMHYYKQMMDYLERLQESYLEERDNDPTSPKTMMLDDEFTKAQNRVSKIYEYRERKIVLLALQVANGGLPILTLITEEEKKIFESLVDILSENRTRILLKKEEDTCDTKTFFVSDEKQSEIIKEKELNDIKDPTSEEKIKEKEKEKSITDNMTDNKTDIIVDKTSADMMSDTIPDKMVNTMEENFKQKDSVILILEDIPSFETEERTFALRKDDIISLSKKFANILCKHKKARVIDG